MDKIRALIVDDSSVMPKIVERSLRQAGIDLEKVVEAGNGAEALSALRENPVDLILCDINMPVMDGLEFVRQVRDGFAPDRLSAEGYAEYHPIAPNRASEGRGMNRRVDIVILGRGMPGNSNPDEPQTVQKPPPSITKPKA